MDTRSATPCPNSELSTPAATLNVGTGVAAPEAALALGGAAPATKPAVVDVAESLLSPRGCLSDVSALASAVTAASEAVVFAAAAVAAAVAVVAVTAEDGGGNPAASAACWPVPPTAGVDEPSAGEDEVFAAAAALGATAPLAAVDIATAAAVGAAGLPSVAGTVLAVDVVPSSATLTREFAVFDGMSLSAVLPLRVFDAAEAGADSGT
jgi:hypothetical protein